MSPRRWYWLTAIAGPLLIVLGPAVVILRDPQATQAPWIACIALGSASVLNALAPIFGRCPACGNPSRPEGLRFPRRCRQCSRPL
jgi:hypothetical protein